MSARADQPRALESPARAGDRRRFVRLADGATLYTLFVILFGAVVRITGSGAGCGQHWPTCNGEIAHLPKSVETVIELLHRVTSGLSLLVVVVLALRSRRIFPRAHRVRRASFTALALMFVEALVGAALVLFEWVGMNRSLGRAIVMPVHLLTTSALIAALLMAAWWAREPARGGAIGLGRSRVTRGLLSAGALGILMVSATGAVTALGDTVFPVAGSGLGAGLQAAAQHGAHFLEQLRILHPMLAVLVTGFLFYASSVIAASQLGGAVERCTLALRAALVLQLVAGFANVLFSAPGWLQVVHLALATVIWGSWVLLFINAEDALHSEPRASRSLERQTA